jgi:hypothetical protein
MKSSKINFFTTNDGKTWLDKDHVIILIKEFGDKYQKKKKFVAMIMDEIKKAKKVE